MIKRIIPIILSVVLFIGLLPNKAVWANDSVDEIQPNEYRDDIDIVENNSEEIVAETNVSTVDGDITVSASWC
ncbi:hypothetical protein C289_2812 [Anoxybacillus ayderensis]|nr:hypothetical protein C289_2812 [Anoxybacillus ayderensis]